MTTPKLQQEIEQFLYREARLLDNGRYREWLALFTDDVHYWIPVRETTADRGDAVRALGQLALMDDDKEFLAARIERMEGGLAHAESPPSRTRRFISNVELEAAGTGDLEVGCNLLVYQTRLERTEAVYFGRREDRLRKVSGDWRIARRKVVLDQTLLPRTVSIFL